MNQVSACLVEGAELALKNTSPSLSFLSFSFFSVVFFFLLLFLSFLFACFALSFWRCFLFLSFGAFSGWSCQQSSMEWLVRLQWLQGRLPFWVSKGCCFIGAGSLTFFVEEL